MNNEIKAINTNALERYKKYAKKHYQQSKKSADNRISAVKKFIEFLNQEGRNIEVINHGSVEEFLSCELENEDISVITVQNYFSFLKGFFGFLKDKDDNIKLEYDKINFDRVKIFDVEKFTTAEISEIFKIINMETNLQIKLSNRIIFKLLFYTGCTLNELYSINVFKHSDDIIDEDNYIALDIKEIYFRNPIQRMLKLTDDIIKDIIDYHHYIENLRRKKLPVRVPLLLSNYGIKKNDKSIKKLKYSTIQNRMAKIKEKSSFSNKNLSIKNIRHTLIYNLIADGISLEDISNHIGIDISTLKIYLKEKEYDINFMLRENPYLSIITKN